MADAAPAGRSGAALAAEFASAMRRCLDLCRGHDESTTHLFTALSGGPDSTALACLTRDYAAQHGLRHTALIVDHRIRDDSTVEARRVAGRMRDIGLDAEILTVQDGAPATGLQAWARGQRYALMLARARRDRGCLLLGHHAGDQAETVMMRLSRGSGLAGLAGMARVSLRDGVMVLRPLLDMPAAALVDFCAARGLVFEQDPSNLDRRFERVRIRQGLALMAGRGSAMSDQLARLAGAARDIDNALLRGLAGADCLPVIQPAGFARLPGSIDRLPPTIGARLLAHVIGQVARPSPPPSRQSLDRLVARLAAKRAATLGGARVSPDGGDWLVTAEPGRRPPRLHVRAGQRVVFAGIWDIASPVDGVVRHLGRAGSGAARDWMQTPGWCALPSLARRAMPVLETLDGALIYPHLQTRDMGDNSITNATARFLPLPTYRN